MYEKQPSRSDKNRREKSVTKYIGINSEIPDLAMGFNLPGITATGEKENNKKI